MGWGLADREAVDMSWPYSSSLPLPLHMHFPLLCSTHSYPPRLGSSVKVSLAKVATSCPLQPPSLLATSLPFSKQASVGDHTTPWGGMPMRLCDSAPVRIGLSSPLCPNSPEQLLVYSFIQQILIKHLLFCGALLQKLGIQCPARKMGKSINNIKGTR